MESNQIKQAQKLMEEAAGCMAGGKTVWLFFKESPDFSRAAELYTEAGNLFKVSKAWREAGDAFIRAADADIAGGEPEEAARKQISAASCYKKVEPEKAINALNLAIGTFLKSGRWHLAASHEKELAEIYETQLEDFGHAAEYYEKAADRYVAEDAVATALSCQLKAANLYALVEHYPKAIEIFRSIVNQWAGDELKKYSMKDYLSRLGITLLCTGDYVNAKRELDKFVLADRTFPSTHEYTMLTAILEALDDSDVDKFTEAVGTFDQVGLLDDWKTKMLLRLKKAIIAEDESLA